MSYCPRGIVGDCPHCGGYPDVKHSFWRGVRLACKCGVSGAWMEYDPHRGAGDPWHSAVDGWPFKWNPRTTPPAPSGW